MSSDKQEEIYLGTRGESFKNLITNLLKRGNIAPKYMKALTDENGIKKYSQAFTASSVDAINNYEMYEQLGDGYFHSFIVWYAYRRFPQLMCPKGVKVVARIKINYGSKQTFHALADKLGFWPFVSASVEQRGKNKKSLLEDVFEAFLGVTGLLLEEHSRPGVGYAIIYDILQSIFDELNISLSYNDLYDPKTRLKQTFDKYKDLGEAGYILERDETNGLAVVTACIKPSNKAPRNQWTKLAIGRAPGQKEAEQKAALQAIEVLKKRGFFRPPDPEYEFFCATV